jgi:hypothetical protein
MIKYLSYVFTLFVVAGFTAAARADGTLKDFYGERGGKSAARAESKGSSDYAGRSFAPNPVGKGREIVIDKQGRRIGLAIPNFHGETNDHLLRLRSGKRVGNQIFNSAGRRAGTIIKK